MDFYGNTPSLSMNGSSSIATIQNDIDTINNTVVFKAGTQTITGDKTFTGTLEINNNTKDTTIVCDDYSQTSNNYSLNVLGSFVQSVNGIAKLIYGAGNTDYKQGVSHTFYIGAGNPISINSTGLAIETGYGISSNGLTISDVELGYLDGTTSNIQTQINAKANDNAVVHLAGTETITGTKTFSVNPISATVPTTNSELANKKYVDDTIVAGAFVNISGTQTITGDKTLQGTTTFTGNIVANSLTISPTELGYLDGTTSNIQTQITARALDNAVVHLSGTETITGTKTFTNNINVSGTGDNSIDCGAFPRQTFIKANGTTKISTGSLDTNITNTTMQLNATGTAGQNLILSHTGGGDIFLTTASGSNILNTTSGDNRIQVGGTTKITSTATQNTFNNTTNILQSGGVSKITTNATYNLIQNDTNYIASGVGTAKITTTSTTTTLDNTTNIIANAGTSKITTTSALTSMNNTTTSIESAGIAKITTNATTNTFDNITNQIFSISTAQKLSIDSSTTRTDNKINMTTFPLVNFALSGAGITENGLTFQISIGNTPLNATINAPITFMLPFKSRCVAVSTSGDAEAHVAMAIRTRISTALAGGGTLYWDSQGDIVANALTNSSICMDLNGNVSGYNAPITVATPIDIPRGTELYCYANTSSALLCEFNVVLYFQQVP